MSTLKKQLIAVIIIAVLAAGTIIAYNVFKSEPEKEPEIATYYFTEADVKAIEALNTEMTFYLLQKEEYYTAEGVAEAQYSFNAVVSNFPVINKKISVEYSTDAQAQERMTKYSAADRTDLILVCGSTVKVFKQKELFKAHDSDGTLYALNRGMLADTVLALGGASPDTAEDFIVTSSKFDIDGDYVGTSLRPYVFEPLERADVKYLVIKNGYETYTVYKNEAGTFQFLGADTVSYNAEMFSSMLVNAIYTLSLSKIGTVDNYADYGLESEDAATAVVEVFTVDDKYHKMLIGDKTSSGNGYYAKYYNKDYVYIIDTGIEDALLHPVKDFLTGELVYKVETQELLYTVDDIHINYRHQGEEIKATLLDPEDDDGTSVKYLWKITDPKAYIPADKTFVSPSNDFFDFINSVTTLTTSSVVEYKMTQYDENGKKIMRFDDETLKKYTLDDPMLEISYYFNDTANKYETRTILYISEKTEQGFYYAYSYVISYDKNGAETKYSTGVIATLSADNVPWTEWTVLKYMEGSVFNMYIDQVLGITATYGGNDYEFKTFFGTDGKISSVGYNGKEIDLLSFRYFYQAILTCKLVGKYENTDSEPVEMFRLKINTKAGEYEYVFYRVSNKKAYYTLNGTGMYYTLTDYIFGFQDKVQKLINGEKIDGV